MVFGVSKCEFYLISFTALVKEPSDDCNPFRVTLAWALFIFGRKQFADCSRQS